MHIEVLNASASLGDNRKFIAYEFVKDINLFKPKFTTKPREMISVVQPYLKRKNLSESYGRLSKSIKFDYRHPRL